jgi:hypothetical protein
VLGPVPAPLPGSCSRPYCRRSLGWWVLNPALARLPLDVCALATSAPNSGTSSGPVGHTGFEPLDGLGRCCFGPVLPSNPSSTHPTLVNPVVTLGRSRIRLVLEVVGAIGAAPRRPFGNRVDQPRRGPATVSTCSPRLSHLEWSRRAYQLEPLDGLGRCCFGPVLPSIPLKHPPLAGQPRGHTGTIAQSAGSRNGRGDRRRRLALLQHSPSAGWLTLGYRSVSAVSDLMRVSFSGLRT